MAEVKWIKITTNMFDHDKLDFIESLPESDAIIVIWIRLLTLAGKANEGGYVLLTESIPYTEDMLSHKFRKPLNIVRLALETLKRLNMIEFDGESIRISNWEKHQNVDGLDKIRDQTKKRVQKYRNTKKLTDVTPCNVTVTGNVTPSNETDIELDLELDKDKKNHEEELTAMDAYIFSFKKLQYTGHIQDYVSKLMQRGCKDLFVREVFMEMGERGIGADVNYMKKLAEDWISKGIKTRQEAKENREAQKAGGLSGGSQEGIRQGGSVGDDKPPTSSKSGVLPSKYLHLLTEDVQVS